MLILANHGNRQDVDSGAAKHGEYGAVLASRARGGMIGLQRRLVRF
jgi:hypothetical protein